MNMQSTVYGEDGWNTALPEEEGGDDYIFDPNTKAARPNPNFVSSGPINQEQDDGADSAVNFGQAHLDLVIMEGSGLNQVYGSWVSGKFLIPGRSDPYVVCRASSGQILTVTKPLDSRMESTDQAVWNHYAGVPYMRGQALFFEIHDTESDTLLNQDVIATAVLQADMMKPGVHDLPLVDKENNKGMLKVGIISTPTKPLHDQELVLMVSSAKRLHNVFEENFGGLKSSPYVVCEVPGKEDKLNFKTQTIKHDLSPKWNFPSVLRFKNFDACEKLKFKVYNDTGDKTEHQLLGTGIMNPEDIMVGVHKIPLCDEMGEPVLEDSELKVRIFSVPKLLRIVARKNETERRRIEEAEAAGLRWEDMTPEEQAEFLEQKANAKADRRRAKELRRALRSGEEDPCGGDLQTEILRLREEVARLRIERDCTWDDNQCSTTALDEQVAELQRQQLALRECQMSPPCVASAPCAEEIAYQKLRNQAMMASTACPMGTADIYSMGASSAYGSGGLCQQSMQPMAVPACPAPAVNTGLGGLPQCSPVQQSLGELQQAISSLGLGPTTRSYCDPQQARFGGYGQMMAPQMMSRAF